MPTKTNLRTTVATIALLALGLASASQATADTRKAPVVSTASIALHYQAQALLEEDRRRELDSRIETAARALCGPLEIKSFHARRLWKACYDTAVADAKRQLDRTALAALR